MGPEICSPADMSARRPFFSLHSVTRSIQLGGLSDLWIQVRADRWWRPRAAEKQIPIPCARLASSGWCSGQA